jgi:antitoxin (DNA-binding transcriptional repressor) of toxin-antitoxin stability system
MCRFESCAITRHVSSLRSDSGEALVRTVHGRPVADIVPRRTRCERRPTELLVADLAAIRELADELDVVSDPTDFETGLVTGDTTST